MPGNGQGGGPKGGGPKGGGPWGGGGGGGGDPGPWGRGSGNNGGGNGGSGGPKLQPPDFDEMLRQLRDRLHRLFPAGGGNARIAVFAAAGLAVLWLATGIYNVQPDEQGVVLRFGAYRGTTQPGLHYHLPAPIEEVWKPKVTRVNRTEIGMTTDYNGRTGSREDVPQESLMLTGDENIVDINLTVFWVIKDARAYLFNIRNPELTVKSAAESAIREIVGRTPIASVLAEGRGAVEADTAKLLQSVLDSYGAGLEVTQVQLQQVDPPQQVIDAFRDVQRARTDLDRQRNEAEAYRNDILPRARGEAQRLIQEAEAYRQEIVARAEGDAQRFMSVLTAYRAAKDVTAERLYIETMEQVLKNANKVLLDRSAAGVVPYLPMQNLLPAPPPPAATTGGAGR